MHACTHAKSLESCPTLRHYGLYVACQVPLSQALPWDSPGKNAGVDYHTLYFITNFLKLKELTQSENYF